MTEVARGELAAYRARLDTRFAQVDAVFGDLMAAALAVLRSADIDDYLDAAGRLGRLGRGVEPMLVFLEEWPAVVRSLGDATLLPEVMDLVMRMQKSPNGRAIAPFLQSLAAVARQLRTHEQMRHYLDLCLDLMARTTGSIHGRHATFESPGLPAFTAQAPRLLEMLNIGGLRNWIEYGIRNHGGHPQRQREYFAAESADSRAVLQRERHGTLFAAVERRLDLYLRALWQQPAHLVPYSTAYDAIRRPVPYDDALGMRVPDAFDDLHGVAGIDRYRAVLAHMAGHRRWSTPQIADNWSPFQRLAVEFFEDARVDLLLMREYPGLAPILRALHPAPAEGGCDPETTSCLRHRLAMLSRACLDPDHGYADPVLGDFERRLRALLAGGPSTTAEVAALALDYVARTRRASDQFARVHFDDTVVDYRDDNRHLWRYIESGDEEESFDQPRRTEADDLAQGLPPRLYPEWDYATQTYRPDWVSLYEALHPAGAAGDIDRILAGHAVLARRLERLLDLLKPQDRVRVRYQEEGSELDLDVAIRSLIDFKGGAVPDPRINLRHDSNGRDIAVSLLLDLSESLNQPVAGSTQTVLELSQEAVSLLAWAIERLGDPFAIAGFRSDGRHDVRYLHIKGYGERFGDAVKARLSAMRAGWSTRMGVAMRHAAHYLAARPADKKLLLVLTDGRPSDVDVQDERLLVEDARRAVRELDQQGIASYCISLDPAADDYVADIFSRHYAVIDDVRRLPEKLPALFMALTR